MARKTFTQGQTVMVRLLDGKWHEAVYKRSEQGPRKTSKIRHYADTKDGRRGLLFWPNEIRTLEEHTAQET